MLQQKDSTDSNEPLSCNSKSKVHLALGQHFVVNGKEHYPPGTVPAMTGKW